MLVWVVMFLIRVTKLEGSQVAEGPNHGRAEKCTYLCVFVCIHVCGQVECRGVWKSQNVIIS